VTLLKFLKIIRAPFLSSISSPILAGTLLAVLAGAHFSIPNFILVLIMGLGLHAATNVYNDIYDTLQGTDRVNENRTDFSGGSGLIVNDPDILPTMFRVARASLIVAFLATFALMFFVDKSLWPLLWILYFLSAFFSKYYTAAPVKLSYRGWGEVSVWFAFGPMAILVAAVSQNSAFHPYVLAALPTTGLSTLSILLVGEMNDVKADKSTGKMGIAARKGNQQTMWIYFAVQSLLMLNIILLAIEIVHQGWALLMSLVPYLIFFPKLVSLLSSDCYDPNVLEKAGGLNVKIHLLFSGLFIIGLLLIVLLV